VVEATLVHATPPIVKEGVVAAIELDPKLVPDTVNTTLPWVGADEGVIEVMDGGKNENDCAEVLARPETAVTVAVKAVPTDAGTRHTI